MITFQLYVIEFKNGKRYFGITSQTLAKRWGDHRKVIVIRAYPLYSALTKHGLDVKIKTLVIGEREYIRNLEVLAIDRFQTRDRKFGYNLTRGGDISPMHIPEIAAKVSATKKRIGLTDNMRAVHAKRIGSKASRETIERLRASHLGKKWSDEQRRKSVGRVSSKKGTTASDEQKEKNRQAKLAWFQIPGNKERHIMICRDIVRREKLSNALMGHPGFGKGGSVSAEIRAKISSSKMGHPVSSETRSKLSLALKGRPRAVG